jgi:hypothetical protein
LLQAKTVSADWEGGRMTCETSLLQRLEAESAELEALLDVVNQLLELDPTSESLRDAAVEMKRAAEHLRMVITKLRSLG